MRLWPLIERGWLILVCALDVAAAMQARASIAVRCQVLQRECSSQMRCHLALLWMQVVYALTTGTEGRALAISTCYTGSAGSLSSLSQHGRHQPE